MTLHDPTASTFNAAPAARYRLAAFAVTLFASALLLFAVQPMFTKMVLSNLGSFVALLAYPLAIESLLPLRGQAWAWSAGFAILALMSATAGVIAARGEAAVVTETATAPTLRDRLSWITLAAIPAGLTIA